MSTDFYVACPDCKEYAKDYIYCLNFSGMHTLVKNEKFQDRLISFLEKHALCHNLKIVPEHVIYEYQEAILKGEK